MVESAFRAAVFLASEVWLVNSEDGLPYACTWRVGSDPGAIAQKPEISLAGLIVVSFMHAQFLSGLFAMAFYSAHSPRWADQLDSFAMMRIGTSILIISR